MTYCDTIVTILRFRQFQLSSRLFFSHQLVVWTPRPRAAVPTPTRDHAHRGTVHTSSACPSYWFISIDRFSRTLLVIMYMKYRSHDSLTQGRPFGPFLTSKKAVKKVHFSRSFFSTQSTAPSATKLVNLLLLPLGLGALFVGLCLPCRVKAVHTPHSPH